MCVGTEPLLAQLAFKAPERAAAMRVVYFVHNLNDPAVAKRVRMLRQARIDVLLIGFWRDVEPAAEIGGAKTFALGQTFDAAFAHRAASALRYAVFSSRLLKELRRSDVFLARNLEMLAIASSAAGKLGGVQALVYEVLDIHRLMLSNGVHGRCLRALERSLIRGADLLITSSPAFLREYFGAYQRLPDELPAVVVENKPIAIDIPDVAQAEISAGPPWRIGWFGMIRCLRSLNVLSELAVRRPDLVDVEIRGRPTREIADAVGKWPAQLPNLKLGGRYRPEDLKELYNGVHFNWAIDYYEDEGNSRWLLSNRIYEGGQHNAVPIARSNTEAGRWLNSRNLGVLVSKPETQLEALLEQMTPSAFQALKEASRVIPRSDFIATQQDCDRLGESVRFAATARYERGAQHALRWRSPLRY